MKLGIQSDSTEEEAFALLVAYPGLIPSTSKGPPEPTGVIPEARASKPRAPKGLAPKTNKNNQTEGVAELNEILILGHLAGTGRIPFPDKVMPGGRGLIV